MDSIIRKPTTQSPSLAEHVYLDELMMTIEDIGFKLEDFDFSLPEHFIAKNPRAARSTGRLLCLEKANGQIKHASFSELHTFFEPGDLLVFNDTKIIPSKLLAAHASGQIVDVFVERVLDERHMIARIFKQSALKIGDILTVEKITLKINDKHDEFYELVLDENNAGLWELIYSHGELAFPTYFERQPTKADKQRFQTIYAKHQGSVSAPSAGRKLSFFSLW